jgi:hypothetical protein
MDGTHAPHVRVCVTDTTCVNRPLAASIVVRGSDWPVFGSVDQRPDRLAAGKTTGAIAAGRVVFSDTRDPAAGVTVRLSRHGGPGKAVDKTGGDGRFTAPWPWTDPGADRARLVLTASAVPDVAIDQMTLGNPSTRFAVPTPAARPLLTPGKRLTVKGVVTPGYPAGRLGSVELQLLTRKGWVTRDRAHVTAVNTAGGPVNKARYSLSTRLTRNGKNILRVAKGAAMCGGGDCRVAGNTSDRFTVTVGRPAYLVEARLNHLRVPVGTVDGTVDERSRQAFCAWRDMTGEKPSRRGLTPQLMRSVMSASSLPKPKRSNGLYVSKTCQVLFQVEHRHYKRVVWVSTGMPGHQTPNGTGAIFRKVTGWVESTLYPGAFMFNPMFFFPDRPAIAIHGSVSNSLVLPHPASHGCVRTWRPQVAMIFDDSPIGTKVKVYGRY